MFASHRESVLRVFSYLTPPTVGNNEIIHSDYDSLNDALLISTVLSVDKKSWVSVPACAAMVAEPEL